MTIRVCLLAVLFVKVLAFWPPPHEIHLEDGATFVISDLAESDDLLTDEDEMIQVKTASDTRKYFKVDQIAKYHNKKEEKRNLKKKSGVYGEPPKFQESNFDLEEPIPAEAGFVDDSGHFIKKVDLIDGKLDVKREDEEQDEESTPNYDYNSLKDAYQKEIKMEEKANNTFNYTEVEEEETVKEAVEKVVDFKEPKNCTEEEKIGIGIGAIECIVTDLRTTKSKDALLSLVEKLLKIALIWFCVYAIIAIPCWCTQGWCCCCCCCKICKPREIIEDAKTFFTQNPVGVYHAKDGRKIEYEPTTYEIYSQRQLEKALLQL